MCIRATLGSLELLILHTGAHQIVADPSIVNIKEGPAEPFEVTGLKVAADLVVTNEDGEVVCILPVDHLSDINRVKMWDPSMFEFYLHERSLELNKLVERYSH